MATLRLTGTAAHLRRAICEDQILKLSRLELPHGFYTVLCEKLLHLLQLPEHKATHVLSFDGEPPGLLSFLIFIHRCEEGAHLIRSSFCSHSGQRQTMLVSGCDRVENQSGANIHLTTFCVCVCGLMQALILKFHVPQHNSTLGSHGTPSPMGLTCSR